MSSNLRDTTTVSEWLDRLPVNEQVRDEAESRTEEQKQLDLQWHMELLADADHARLCCMFIYVIQVLARRDPASAIYLLEQLHEKIVTETAIRTFFN